MSFLEALRGVDSGIRNSALSGGFNSWEGMGAALSGLFGGPKGGSPLTAFGAGGAPGAEGIAAGMGAITGGAPTPTPGGGMKLDMALLAPVLDGLMKGPKETPIPPSPSLPMRAGGPIMPVNLPGTNPASIRRRT